MFILSFLGFTDIDPVENPIPYLVGLIELFIEIAVFLSLIVFPLLKDV